MSMTDPIADMLTRIRNAQSARKTSVSMPASKAKQAIARVLESEGYVTGFDTDGEGSAATLTVELKYHQGARSLKKSNASPSRVYVFIGTRIPCQPSSVGSVSPLFRRHKA